MSENYSSGTVPLRTNPIRVIEVKILNALNDGAGSGSDGEGLVGIVDPEGSATSDPGVTYYNTANATFWVKGSGTGNTGWVQVV